MTAPSAYERWLLERELRYGPLQPPPPPADTGDRWSRMIAAIADTPPRPVTPVPQRINHRWEDLIAEIRADKGPAGQA